MFNGTSNLRYLPLGETAIIWLELKVRESPLNVPFTIKTFLSSQVVIKPHHKDGLILFSGKSDLGDFIALYLNFGKKKSLDTFTESIFIQKNYIEGFVEFIYDLGSGVTSVRSKYPLSLNEWHAIKISRTARLAVLKVDEQPETMTVSPNGFWHLSLPFSLYLGELSRRIFMI